MRESSIESHPELHAAGRTLAFLALERLRQDGALPVRQREQLRRALVTAGKVLDWGQIPGERTDRAAAVNRDMAALADFGAKTLDHDLARQLDEKGGEIDALQDMTRTLRALAADPDASYPAEIAYAYTARDGQRRLVTRTEALVLANADEASDAAALLEKRLEGYAKLRDQIVEDLARGRRQIDVMREGLGSFVASSNGLVLEVLASLR